MQAGGTQAAVDRTIRSADSAALEAARDRALATQLVYGVTKMRRALVWSLERLLRQPFASLDQPVQAALLIGAFQLLYLKKIPAHSAVDESVELERRYGRAAAAGLVNAVLRRLSVEPALPAEPATGSDIRGFADWASVPDWMARHWIARFGFERARQIATGVNAQARRALRVNVAHTTVAAIKATLAHNGVVTRDSRYGIQNCLAFERGANVGRELSALLREGTVTLQSEESQLAVALLDLPADGSVLDVCAGRGVKAGAIAERLTADAAPVELFALDDDQRKLGALAQEFKRLRLRFPITVCADARRPFPDPVPKGAAAVLVDAPCTGIGTVGRHAEMRWQKSEDDGTRMARTQLAILMAAAQSVAEGGTLLYVVCSTLPAENEGTVEAFLRATSGWAWAPLAVSAPAGTTQAAGNGVLTIPGIDGADGFFYAKLVRSP